MRTVYKIIIYLLLLVLLTAEDCSERSSESQQTESYRTNMFLELEKDFIAEELDYESLQAIEKRAVQKFHELIGYINIYADSGLQIQFRQQARQMITEVFVSEQDVQLFFTNIGFVEDTVLKNLLTLDEKNIQACIESVQITKAFQISSESDYMGEISYHLTNQKQISEQQIKIVARKVSKSFGEESLDVWELFFKD